MTILKFVFRLISNGVGLLHNGLRLTIFSILVHQSAFAALIEQYMPQYYFTEAEADSACRAEYGNICQTWYPNGPIAYCNGPFRLRYYWTYTNYPQVNPDQDSILTHHDFYYCLNSGASCPFGQALIMGKCSTSKNKLKPDQCSVGNAVGNPINQALGNKIQEEIDYRKTGNSPLTFSRLYSSISNTAIDTTGKNWQHNFQRFITLKELNQAAVQRKNGEINTFVLKLGNWQADADIADKLVQLTNNGTISGWQYFDVDDSVVETYDATGKLISINNANGLTQTLSYSVANTPTTIAPFPGLLIAAQDDFGRNLSFTYDANGRMVSMTDPQGNVTQYSYDSIGNLIAVTQPDGSSRQYLYNEPVYTSNTNLPNALTGIMDENGTRYATYHYNTDGKAVSTEHAGGVEKYQLSYNADSTSVTNPLGSVSAYRFTSVLGVVKSVGQDQPAGAGCAASASNLGYDANGNIASRTDFNGNLSCHGYDLSRNLENARIEGIAAGGSCPANVSTYTPNTNSNERKITTAWHPDWRFEIQRAEPSKLTTWVYNGQPDPSNGNTIASCAPTTALLTNGLPIAVLCKKIEQATADPYGAFGLSATVTGESRIWTYTYNSLSQILTADGPRNDVNDVTSYSYYGDGTASHKPGDLWKITNALGHVTTFNAYDANGRPLSVTDPNGLVFTLAYDARQRLVSFTAGSETTSYTYDPAGLVTRITRPDGAFLDYTYDAAHRLIKTQDNLGNSLVYTLDAMGNRVKEDMFDPSGQLARSQSRIYDALSRLQNLIQAQ